LTRLDPPWLSAADEDTDGDGQDAYRDRGDSNDNNGRAQLRDRQHQVGPAAEVSGTLVLASASPRRRELLQRVGLSVEVRVREVDETPAPGEEPVAYVQRVARAKAAAVERGLGEWVLAADTTVAIEGTILGKAASREDAAQMLRALSGRVHRVITAFVLAGDGPVLVARHVTTAVEMIAIDDAALADYIASGEWRGKAGAYAIQGIAAALVARIDGSVTNVIGLPLAEVLAALREVGGPVPRFAAGVPA
jgi:septum formation protein